MSSGRASVVVARDAPSIASILTVSRKAGAVWHIRFQICAGRPTCEEKNIFTTFAGDTAYMRRLTHIDMPTRMTAVLLGLVYVLALMGQAVHQHDARAFSVINYATSQSDTDDGEHHEASSEVYLVNNVTCPVCEFHLGITDQCTVAPSFAVDEWDAPAPELQPEAVHLALREGKALRAPPVRYC